MTGKPLTIGLDLGKLTLNRKPFAFTDQAAIVKRFRGLFEEGYQYDFLMFSSSVDFPEEYGVDDMSPREIEEFVQECIKEALSFRYDDGGRKEAGFKGHTGDCVTRSIAIASQIPYKEVYDALALGMKEAGKKRSARNGILKKVYKRYLEKELGWAWVPTMKFGEGCRVHLKADELPSGRLVVRLTKHLTAMINGVVHDTYEPSRGGTRCVYGYWHKEE